MMLMFGRHRRGRGIPAVVGLVMGSGFFLMIGLIKATSALGPLSLIVWAMAIAGATIVLRGRLGDELLHAIARSDEEPQEGGVPPELVNELDDLRAQVGELQERVDFAERLLAREREAKPLGTGDRP